MKVQSADMHFWGNYVTRCSFHVSDIFLFLIPEIMVNTAKRNFFVYLKFSRNAKAVKFAVNLVTIACECSLTFLNYPTETLSGHHSD